MRWSNRHNDDNLKALLRGEGGGRLGPALAELREQAPEAPAELRERIRLLAAEEPPEEPARRPRLRGYRFSLAHVGAAAAAVLVVAVAIPAIATISGSEQQSADEAAGEALTGPEPGDAHLTTPPAPPAPPPPAFAPPYPGGGGGGSAAQPPQAAPAPPRAAARERAPGPSANRAQDYSSRILLHVDGHDELSSAVQSAIRSTRQLGGYVTYVDYGTSGRTDGRAELAVRVPVGRVQTAVARFSELGAILEQQTEIRDLQGRIDRLTRDIQSRRDRIARLEAELRNPTLSDAERDRLEARLVRAKRGLANATRDRAGVLRQSRFAKLELAFTTEERSEPAPPPSGLRRSLDDAAGILLKELGIALYVLIVAAPFLVLAALAWLGARALRRAANDRVLESA